jgi:hypothetical protein
MKVTRRDHLATLGGALLAAGSAARAAEAHDRPDADDGEVLYGHGLVWNRALEGAARELKLAFDLRVNLETGAGFGTAHDPLFPEWNVHFAITSAERTRVRGGETRFALRGEVTETGGAFAVGSPVRILAETRGDATAVGIAIGNHAFSGAGLVVIAVIAILLHLMLPSEQ